MPSLRSFKLPPHHKTKRKKEWKKPFPSLFPPLKPLLFFPPILSLFASLSSYTHFFHPQACITCSFYGHLLSNCVLPHLFSDSSILAWLPLFHMHTHTNRNNMKRNKNNKIQWSLAMVDVRDGEWGGGDAQVGRG